MSDYTELEVGFDAPARPGMALPDVQTPALIVDLDAFGRNIASMQAQADELGVALRAHAKTHKSADVAAAQMAAGAVGVCCQKVSEAEALARAGVGDILISNEIVDPAKIDRLVRLAGDISLAVCVDDAGNVADLSRAAVAQAIDLTCLVEIDVGAGRCGVEPGQAAVALARAIDAAANLTFGGLQAYNGSAQHIYDFSDRHDAVARVIEKVAMTVDMLRAAGLVVPRITGAGTGTYALEGASGLYTELQCGSYCFMDADYGRVQQGDDENGFENALFVLTGVMSTAKPGRAVCDAGLKSMSFESGLPVVFGLDGVTYTGASDEHGQLADPKRQLAAGDKLRLVPGHCDPTVNLHDWYVCVRGDVVEALWPVTARGKIW